MSQQAESVDETYEAFLDHVKQYHYVGDAAGVLGWDQQVMMPEGGTPARSKQSSALSALSHELLTDDELSAWLDELEGDVEDERAAVVREVKRQHERAVAVPEDLVTRISEATSNALPVWERAKAESDFSAFEETLEDLVALRREYAEAIDPDRDPYEVLFEDYEPYIDIDTAEAILTELREELPALIDAIAESDVEMADPFDGSYGEETQEELVRDALDVLGTTGTAAASIRPPTRSRRGRSSTPA